MIGHQRWGAAIAPLLLAFLAAPARAQVYAPDTTPLEVYQVPAGSSLALLGDRVRSLGGRLGCRRSSRDRAVQECRADFREAGVAVELWLSAIDSLAGIVTFKATGQAQLDRWRDDLERRYGVVPPQPRGPQQMLQWVRRGRMIRLTWVRERGVIVASLSLVDGRVLDGWGRRRS